MIIEFIHPTVSGEACALFARGEVCREFSHWLLKINDHVCRDWEEGKQIVESEASKSRGRDPINTQVSELKIVIRSRREVPYPMPQKALNMAAAAGVSRLSVEGVPR